MFYICIYPYIYLQKSYTYPEGAVLQGLLSQIYVRFEGTQAFFASNAASFRNYKLDCLEGKRKQTQVSTLLLAFPSLLAYTLIPGIAGKINRYCEARTEYMQKISWQFPFLEGNNGA